MTEPAPGPVPLLVDVDTGIDDALALLYACASPEAELLGVTCVSGNVEAGQVALNTLAVLGSRAAPTSRWRWAVACRCCASCAPHPRRMGRAASATPICPTPRRGSARVTRRT